LSDERSDLARVFRRSERIVGRRISSEYVLVPVVGNGAELDAIYNLNRVGAFIWEQLDGATNGDAIVRAIVDTFEVEADRAAADYREFIEKLESIRALEAIEGAG
jgi:hypothetical protein